MRRLLYVARHGETDWNVEGRWQGHTDVPLNARGRAQARALGELLVHERIRVVVSSDLSRARETAEIVTAVLGARFAYADPDLRERGFGVFEGRTREECAEANPDVWRVWSQDPRIAPPGAEAYEALVDRVGNATQRALAMLDDDGPALVVTHGGAMRAILARITGSLGAAIPNGAVYVLLHDGERFLGASPFDPES